MTSTNDGKEVKSNQTSGQKGKTYYIELYKSLDAQLNAECELRQRTQHLCEAWRHVHRLCLHSAPTTQTHLIGWLQRHTATTVLLTEWKAPESKDEHSRLEEAINTFIQETQTAIAGRDGRSSSWETELLHRAEWFKTLLADPWGHPVLESLLGLRGTEPPSDKDVLEWLKGERDIVFVRRLRQLAASKGCDDLALLLVTAVMDRVRADLDVIDDVTQADGVRADPKPESEQATFEEVLSTHAGFTEDVWELLTDMEFVLLHKCERRARCIELAKKLPLRSGYPIVERLRSRLKAAPKEKKLWKNAKDVATLITQVVIARCMVIPVCTGLTRTVLLWCTRSLARQLTPAKLPTTANALAAAAVSAKHLHTLATVIEEQSTDDMKPFVCELFVRAITSGMDELERLKLKTEKAKEARAAEQTLAAWFMHLGKLLSACPRVQCECMLTAFSVHPSLEMYNLIKAAPALPHGPLDIQEPKQETTSEFGSWSTDSHSQTNFVKTSETLNIIKKTGHQSNVLSTAILTEGEGLGLGPELCQDIAVLLSGPRVKTLSWDMDRDLLIENCKAYMERTHGGTRALTTELKYLNLDLNQYQHLPEEEDDENDLYYGIEKGYEHLVEFQEPQPEQIWEDAIWDDERTMSACSGTDSDPGINTARRKKKKQPSFFSADDEDPLSLVAEVKRMEKKKERPHSKERSNEDKKKKGRKKEARKEKSKEKKVRRKKKETTTNQEIIQTSGSLASYVGLKVTRVNPPETPHKQTEDKIGNACVTDSDYDSQGKSSLNSDGNDPNVLYDGQFPMDEIKSPEKMFVPKADVNNCDTNKTLIQSQKKPATDQPCLKPADQSKVLTCLKKASIVNDIRSDTHTTKSAQEVKDEVKKGITKLIQFRRQKALSEESRSPTPSSSPNLSAVQLEQKKLEMASLVGSKIIRPTVVMNEKQTEQLNILKNEVNSLLANTNASGPVIQFATKKKRKPPTKSTCSRVQPISPIYFKRTATDLHLSATTPVQNPQPSTTTANEVTPPRNNSMNQITPLPSPVQSTMRIVDHQQSYHEFLKELRGSNNAGLFVTPVPHKKNSKKDIKPVSRVTPVIPNVSKPEPIPPCAKPLQQRKGENAPNTFSRLSYMHKNKQAEIKTEQTQNQITLQNSISAELDQRIADLRLCKGKYVNPKSDLIISRVDKTLKKPKETSPRVEVQKVENDSSLVIENPVLSNILRSNPAEQVRPVSRNDNHVKGIQIEQPKSPKSTSALVKKDQQELLLLLRQQTKLNSYMHMRPSQTIDNTNKIINNLQSSNTTVISYGSKSTAVPSTSTPMYTQTTETQKASVQVDNATALLSNINTVQTSDLIKNSVIQKPLHTMEQKLITSCVKNLNVPIKIQNTLSDTILNNRTVEKNAVKICNVDKDTNAKQDWVKVLDELSAHRTPSRGPNALDIVLKKDSYEKFANDSLRNQRIVKVNTQSPGETDKCKNITAKQKSVAGTPKPAATVCTVHKKPIQVKTGQTTAKKSSQDAAKAKKPNPIDTPKRSSQDLKKKLNCVQKDDPFISGIHHSDYDLLEELMDDDLRQEIGELMSEDESYNSPPVVVPKESKKTNVKSGKPKPKVLETILSTNKEKCAVNTAIVAKNPSEILIKTCTKNTAKSKPVILSNERICTNLPKETTQRISHVIHHFPKTSIPPNANMPTYNVNNNTIVTSNQVRIEPTNVLLSASQPTIPNVVVIGTEIVFDPFSTPIQGICGVNQNAFVLNNAQNLSMYQQYSTPVNPLIGSALMMSVATGVPTATISTATLNSTQLNESFAPQIVIPESTNHCDSRNSTNTVPAVIHTVTQNEVNIQEEKCEMLQTGVDTNSKLDNLQVDINVNKSCERKVLSEVQEKLIVTVPEKIDFKTQRLSFESEVLKEALKDEERLKNKRMVLINREISSRSFYPPIPLPYAPIIIPKPVVTEKRSNSKNKKTDIKRSVATNDCNVKEVEKPTEAKICDESPATPDSLIDVESTVELNNENTKENKDNIVPCRRILLRSSNTLKPKSVPATVIKKTGRKTKVRLKPSAESADDIDVGSCAQVDKKIETPEDNKINETIEEVVNCGKSLELSDKPEGNEDIPVDETASVSPNDKFTPTRVSKRILDRKMKKEVLSKKQVVSPMVLEDCGDMKPIETTPDVELFDIEDALVGAKISKIKPLRVLIMPLSDVAGQESQRLEETKSNVGDNIAAVHEEIPMLEETKSNVEDSIAAAPKEIPIFEDTKSNIEDSIAATPKEIPMLEDTKSNAEDSIAAAPKEISKIKPLRVLIMPLSDVAGQESQRLEETKSNVGNNIAAVHEEIPMLEDTKSKVDDSISAVPKEIPMLEETESNAEDSIAAVPKEIPMLEETNSNVGDNVAAVPKDIRLEQMSSEDEFIQENEINHIVPENVEDVIKSCVVNSAKDSRLESQIVSKNILNAYENSKDVRETAIQPCVDKNDDIVTLLEQPTVDKEIITERVSKETEDQLPKITKDIQSKMIDEKIQTTDPEVKHKKPNIGTIDAVGTILSAVKLKETEIVPTKHVSLSKLVQNIAADLQTLTKSTVGSLSEKTDENKVETIVASSETKPDPICDLDMSVTVEEPVKIIRSSRKSVIERVITPTKPQNKDSSMAKRQTDLDNSVQNRLLKTDITNASENQLSKHVEGLIKSVEITAMLSTDINISSQVEDTSIGDVFKDEYSKELAQFDEVNSKLSKVVSHIIEDKPIQDVTDEIVALDSDSEINSARTSPSKNQLSKRVEGLIKSVELTTMLSTDMKISSQVEDTPIGKVYEDKYSKELAQCDEVNAKLSEVVSDIVEDKPIPNVADEIIALDSDSDINDAGTSPKSVQLHALSLDEKASSSFKVKSHLNDKSVDVALDDTILKKKLPIKQISEIDNILASKLASLSKNAVPKPKTPTPISNDTKNQLHSIPQAYKDSIKIKEIPLKYGANPLKRCVRIKIPNGKSFRATISGREEISFDTIFSDPSLKNILENLENSKRYTLNIEKNFNSGYKIVNRVEKDIDIEKPIKPVETVNLVSDDEEDNIPSENTQCFNTEFGKYYVKSLDETTYNQHKNIFSKKCFIKLSKCDENIPKIEEKVYEQPQMIEKHVNGPVTTQKSPEVIEIDDESSTDGETISENRSVFPKPPITKINEFKYSLLKDLGADFLATGLEKEKETNCSILDVSGDFLATGLEKEKENKCLIDVPENITDNQIGTNNSNNQAEAMVTEEHKKKIYYSELINRKYCVKLVRCDDLLKKMGETEESNLQPDDDSSNVSICDFELNESACEPALSRSGSFSILNSLGLLDDVIEPIDDMCDRNSHVMDIYETIAALMNIQEIDRSSPVMEAFEMLASLQNTSKDVAGKLPDLSERITCHSDWLASKPKLGLEQQIQNANKLGFKMSAEIFECANDISTDCESYNTSFDKTNLDNISESYNVPRLAKIMSEYFKDSKLVNHLKGSLETKRVTTPTHKRKLSYESCEVVSKTSKIENIPLPGGINGSSPANPDAFRETIEYPDNKNSSLSGDVIETVETLIKMVEIQTNNIESFSNTVAVQNTLHDNDLDDLLTEQKDKEVSEQHKKSLENEIIFQDSIDIDMNSTDAVSTDRFAVITLDSKEVQERFKSNESTKCLQKNVNNALIEHIPEKTDEMQPKSQERGILIENVQKKKANMVEHLVIDYEQIEAIEKNEKVEIRLETQEHTEYLPEKIKSGIFENTMMEQGSDEKVTTQTDENIEKAAADDRQGKLGKNEIAMQELIQNNELDKNSTFEHQERNIVLIPTETEDVTTVQDAMSKQIDDMQEISSVDSQESSYVDSDCEKMVEEQTVLENDVTTAQTLRQIDDMEKSPAAEQTNTDTVKTQAESAESVLNMQEVVQNYIEKSSVAEQDKKVIDTETELEEKVLCIREAIKNDGIEESCTLEQMNEQVVKKQIVVNKKFTPLEEVTEIDDMEVHFASNQRGKLIESETESVESVSIVQDAVLNKMEESSAVEHRDEKIVITESELKDNFSTQESAQHDIEESYIAEQEDEQINESQTYLDVTNLPEAIQNRDTEKTSVIEHRDKQIIEMQIEVKDNLKTIKEAIHTKDVEASSAIEQSDENSIQTQIEINLPEKLLDETENIAIEQQDDTSEKQTELNDEVKYFDEDVCSPSIIEEVTLEHHCATVEHQGEVEINESLEDTAIIEEDTEISRFDDVTPIESHQQTETTGMKTTSIPVPESEIDIESCENDSSFVSIKSETTVTESDEDEIRHDDDITNIPEPIVQDHKLIIVGEKDQSTSQKDRLCDNIVTHDVRNNTKDDINRVNNETLIIETEETTLVQDKNRNHEINTVVELANNTVATELVRGDKSEHLDETEVTENLTTDLKEHSSNENLNMDLPALSPVSGQNEKTGDRNSPHRADYVCETEIIVEEVSDSENQSCESHESIKQFESSIENTSLLEAGSNGETICQDVLVEKYIETCDESVLEKSVTLVYKDDTGVVLKGFECGSCYVFPITKESDCSGQSDILNDSTESMIETIQEIDGSDVIYNDSTEDSNEIDDLYELHLKMLIPEVTYSKRNLKRKLNMRNASVSPKKPKRIQKRFRSSYKIRYSEKVPIDYQNTGAVTTFLDEYNRVLDYYDSMGCSYSLSYQKDHIDITTLTKNWPINGASHNNVDDEIEIDETLFIDIDSNEKYCDPLKQTLAEEITTDYIEPKVDSCEADTTNNKMGFGEGSGRVIQNLEGDAVSKFSAATLSDVKQTQPFFMSENRNDREYDPHFDKSINNDQLEKIKHYMTYFKLRDKVRSFFKSSMEELSRDCLKENKEKNSIGNAGFPFHVYTSKSIEPPPIATVVQVVQVGQLPVSAAAQNPVTCDPRVTQVSDASPSQCSVESSPHDDSQQGTKHEYTELTTADISLPLVQDYAQHNQAINMEPQENSNLNMTDDNIPIETEMDKCEVKIELVEETPDDKESVKSEDLDKSNENSELQSMLNNHVNNIDYSFETSSNNTLESDSHVHILFSTSDKQNVPETFSQLKQNGSSEKTDQIAHAMNAAGITTTSEPIQNNRAHALVNILSQKIRQGAVTSTQNSVSYPKTASINAMALQQALAQILPPPLNQTNSGESNQQQNTQVLHIVQGKNASGNQITLVDNSQQSVINAQSGTQLLHIVQNKTGTAGPTSNGTPGSQTNTFSGLSLVDGGMQGGNQLLHIVNTGSQKNNNAGQLLKRVNLLTNLANVQGSNEQKMVQFLCKSADGKAIQLNAPHQRSMVLRLQPIETPNVQAQTAPQKPVETQDLSPTTSAANSQPSKDAAAAQQEIKSRSVYEENYAKFIQNSSTKPSVLEKSTSLPKFNQAFGKPVFQEGNQKQNEMNTNNSHLPVSAPPENTECQQTENSINLEHLGQISSPPLLLRKSPAQTSQSQTNLVQQLKQSIAPMNIQTMHGGVIYTRQIPVNIGGGQTINLITVPSTELLDDSGQKQPDVKFVNQSDIEPSIIKIVPQSQSAPNADVSQDDGNTHLGVTSDNAQNPQPQPVLTQMRIKLPMLSKTPQMVSGARVVRPSFFQIQRNVIGGANQPVYQQLVLTAAPPLGQQTIRLPQAQTRPIKVPSESQSSSESQMSSSTLEQLREFDMVLEQVKERSTVQPNANSTNTFKLHTTSTDTTDSSSVVSSSPTETTQQVLYSIGSNQPLSVAYVNRKATVTTPTTSTFVRSPDSSGIVDSPTSSSHVQIPHTVTTESTSSESSQPKAAKISSKSKSRPKSSSNPPSSMKINTVPPKTSTQKPLEDEQTTQRILYILAEYKEQVENSPDKDKPAPRRRSNPPTNPGSSKRKKSSSGSRRPGGRDLSPVHGEDTCRTMGSEDSSCGTSQGDCTESCMETHSPQDSPRKVVRKLTFEQEPAITQPRPQPQRNVIVADGQTITVARGTAGKPATAVLMPANYILPVSMVKGGQQIAIVTNRGPKLLTVGGEGGTNALLLQRLIGPAGLKPVLARPGVRHVRLPTAALHNLQAFNLTTATTVQPPDSTASPAPAPTPELIETGAESSPWADREMENQKAERGESPDGSEPWNLPSSADPNDYSYEETVRAENLDRTVLDAIPDRYSPDMEAQRIFDKMFDVESKKSYIVDTHVDSPRCGYDIEASDDDKAYHQVVQKKDGQRQHRLTHVSAAALRHKYAILEHELRLQKSLSEECEDLGVDSPSASELFPEAELLFAASPAHDHNQEPPPRPETPQPILNQTVIQPDIDDQIATDQLLPRQLPERPALDGLGLEDVGIVTVSEDGMQATIALDQEEFARAHPNTTFHSEPTDDVEVQPFTLAGLKGRHITSTIFHSNRAPATVLMTAPQSTVISQTTTENNAQDIKYSEIDNMINSIPQHGNNINLSSVLVKDDGLTRFDNILTDSRELHLSNTASAIVHSAGNATQVIRRVCYEDKRERDTRFLIDEPDTLIAGDDAKMVAEDSSREATLESMAGDVDDDNSSPERHAELFWESNSASERSESRRPLDYSSDSDKCCKSPSFDETNSTDSSGVGTHMRLDSVIKEARGLERSGSADGSSADDTHPPLRTYPPKRTYHPLEGEERSLSGKTRAGERSPDSVRRRASGRGVVKRGCHCCNGSPAPPRPKKPRQRKPTMDFSTN